MAMKTERETLEVKIAATEAELHKLKGELVELDRLRDAEGRRTADERKEESVNGNQEYEGDRAQANGLRWPFCQDEYRRYGRQMIVDQMGREGQLKLRDASVLIVGAGGLGCPAALYLAGAGVGKLGLIDGDTVEESNLHRQVLHRTKNVGKFKVDSAIEYLQEMNPHPKYIAYRERLTSQEALDIFSPFDVILDCTDNPATRYLISDTAVLLGKPLVSASALRTEGQLMVLNHPARLPGEGMDGGPCYRCVFPKPPPADTVLSCADGGILGPVVGMMGVMQALETIRVITEKQSSSTPPSLHLFSAYSTPPFRSIRLRRRRADCSVCSAKATITSESLRSGSTDYIQFCGSLDVAPILGHDDRLTAKEYASSYGGLPPLTPDAARPVSLIDVRERVQYDICALENSVNIPISEILSSPSTTAEQDKALVHDSESTLPSWAGPLSDIPESAPIYVVCRQGNDSQVAVKKLKEIGIDREGKRSVRDIRGGLDAWRRDVDPEFPDY